MLSFTMIHQQFLIAQIFVTLSANKLGGTITVETGIYVSFQVTLSFEARVTKFTFEARIFFRDATLFNMSI